VDYGTAHINAYHYYEIVEALQIRLQNKECRFFNGFIEESFEEFKLRASVDS
jgi:hypothetical protein